MVGTPYSVAIGWPKARCGSMTIDFLPRKGRQRVTMSSERSRSLKVRSINVPDDVLATLQGRAVLLLRIAAGFPKNGTTIGLKPTRGERSLIVCTFAGIFQAIANCDHAQPGIEKTLDDAELDQITKAEFNVVFRGGELRTPKGRKIDGFALLAIRVTAQPPSDVHWWDLSRRAASGTV